MITATEGKNILKAKIATERSWVHDFNSLQECANRCFMEIHYNNLDMTVAEISDIIFPAFHEILSE